MSRGHNTSGQAYWLSVMTPILRGHESTLARRLDAFGSGAQSPLAAVPGTHFGRWVILTDVVYEGKPEKRDHLELARLLFTSSFDGAPGAYIEALRTGLGAQADAIWEACVGYPGSADAGAFAAYLRRHQIQNALFFAAYGALTVPEVTRGLEDRRRLIDFALEAQGKPAAELQQAFLSAFPA